MDISKRRRPSWGKVLQVALLLLVCSVIAGIPGVLSVLMMFWMTRQKFAVDCHEKHGISHQPASRLGGLAVAFCALGIYWLSVGINIPLERLGESLFDSPLTFALLIGFIGLCDDAIGHLSTSLRLSLTAIIFAAYLLINPSVIPAQIGIPGIDILLNFWPLAFLLCLIACVGLLNATNMADGANGLMPLVFMGTFFGFFILSRELIYLAVTMGLMVFTLFNVLSGRLFLGDSGSYGLGALAALGAIKIISETGAEIWFLLCLAGYPVIDFFASIIRRKCAGRSPLSADSDHMHNRLYRYLRNFIASPLIANSVSGLAISLSTTGVSVLLLSLWQTDSIYWLLLFAGQVITYLVIFTSLPTNHSTSHA